MKLLKNKDHRELLDKIAGMTKEIEELKVLNTKHEKIIIKLFRLFDYYKNNRVGTTRLITNISYILGLSDIPDKYKILKEM